MKWIGLVAGFWMLGCVPLEQSSSASNSSQKKRLLFSDFRYNNNIKTDLLYPSYGFVQDVIEPAVISISSEVGLILEFDELQADFKEYNVKLIHCNSNWTKSTVPDMEFSESFNDFPIREFEYSSNSFTHFTHYTFKVPKVRLAGNYLLVVFYGRNPDDLVLTRRFVVFDSKVQIKPQVSVMTGASARFLNHQIEFDINYRGLKIINPYTDISIVVRQNQRWDNAIVDLRPTSIKEDRTTLEYHHFTRENTFPSVNEFRFLDLRSVSFRGQNVASIDKNSDKIVVQAVIDKSRENQVYSKYSDLNGKYVIENNDPGAQYLEENYIEAHFWLDYPQRIDNIYILGAFNNWQMSRESLMKFDIERQLYSTSFILKQGFYNYQYYVPNGSPHPYYLEGAYFEAENDYEIFVYYREPGTFADIVVGYVNFSNQN
ncbi:MAG: DUF5103 domain-containing protein [Bacteroidetes bacterium]|nr:DUF5103 domain-containing protein [Bacteroidota bacterium]MDA1120264.1 DUF5103 domain-containing protein [Bacteroidota bacterium]